MTAAGTPLIQPSFPPLLSGEAVAARLDPFEKALAAVLTDAEPGRVYWSEDTTAMRTAVVLAPEMPLRDAIGVIFAIALGLSDSLGALAPPEVAVHFVWPDRIKVNGAGCGHIRVAASHADPDDEPEWLIVGVELPVIPVREHEPGETPDETTLHEEGCADITVHQLIESWSRHMLVWINRFLGEGLQPLHLAWQGKCDTIGEDVTFPEPGVFVGMDERGAMLLRQETTTKSIPLTILLEHQR